MTTAAVAPRDARVRNALWTSVVEALPIWLASRLAVAMAGFAGAWVLHGKEARDVPSWLEIWQNWDADLFVKVAEHGYPPTTAYPDRTEVDFPAMPIALRIVHVVTGNWTAAGLIVSLIAGAVTVVALHHLAASQWGPEAGRRAVTYLVCFPYAVFLFAGYSEGLFLAFATSSWVFAKKQRWREASLLCAGASATRLLGLCLAAALVVEYVIQRWKADGFKGLFTRHLPWLAAPAVPVLGFVVYLHHRTGSWTAYQDAQREWWHRETASIPEGFRTTLGQARLPHIDGTYAWSWRAELLAVLGGAILAVLLLLMRRWAEFVYVSTSVVLLAAQNYYASSVRTVMTLFPLYLVLARLTLKKEWAHHLVVATTAPLMIVFVIVFNKTAWVG